jgi:hypothetical protein
MKSPLARWLVGAAGLLMAGCNLAAPGAQPGVAYEVTLSAAEADRAGEVVSFKMPEDVYGNDWALQEIGTRNAPLPLQIDPSRIATAFIARQKAGEVLRYVLVPAETSKTPGAEVWKEDGRLRFSVNKQTVFYYQMALAKPPRDDVADKILRGGFLYPIFTPHGVQMSDSYPVDHPHDHGIWTAWASSTFQGRHVDFWNPHYAYGGTVAFVALDRTWTGAVDAGLEARHRSIDRTVTPNVPALDEKWKVTLYAAPGVPARVFDLEFTQTPSGSDPLEVLQYQYGGLGVRGSSQWLDKTNLQVLTSEGITDRVQSNNQPARWFFMGGKIDGEAAGITVLDDPANFRAPQPVRMNPDGPFFMYAPNIKSGFTISAAQPYHAHYRFLVQDGPPDAKFLEACWQGLAHPAQATIGAPDAQAQVFLSH